MPIGQYIISRFDAGITHDNAVAFATAHSGTLAAITSATENTLFLSFLTQDDQLWGGEPRDTARNGPWIGLMQTPGSAEPAGGWGWDTGETSSFSYWHSGQPDNFVGDSFGYYWDNSGSIGWADQINDPIALGYGPVISAAAEVVSSVRLLNGTSEHDFVWGGRFGNRINGLAGNDMLNGNGGNDTITGGKGADTMTGGTGADVFVFKSVAESHVLAAGRDHITDFTQVQQDKINLSAIDAIPGGAHDPLVFIHDQAFIGSGQVRAHIVGSETWIEVNMTGDATPEMRIVLDQTITLQDTDFTL